MGNYTTHGTALSTPQVLGSQKRIRTAREQAPMAGHVPSRLSCKTGHVSTPHGDRAGDPGTPTKGGHARGRAHVPSKHNFGTKCLPRGNHLQSPPRCQGTSPSPAGHVGGWRNTWGHARGRAHAPMSQPTPTKHTPSHLHGCSCARSRA